MRLKCFYSYTLRNIITFSYNYFQKSFPFFFVRENSLRNMQNFNYLRGTQLISLKEFSENLYLKKWNNTFWFPHYFPLVLYTSFSVFARTQASWCLEPVTRLLYNKNSGRINSKFFYSRDTQRSFPRWLSGRWNYFHVITESREIISSSTQQRRAKCLWRKCLFPDWLSALGINFRIDSAFSGFNSSLAQSMDKHFPIHSV